MQHKCPHIKLTNGAEKLKLVTLGEGDSCFNGLKSYLFKINKKNSVRVNLFHLPDQQTSIPSFSTRLK